MKQLMSHNWRRSCRSISVFILLTSLNVYAQAADSLKETYRPDFSIGVAIPGTDLPKPEQELLLAQFSSITPENLMKPQPLEPQEGKFNFAAADRFVEFARAHQLEIHGHTLVWHSQCPDWFFRDGPTPASRELVLKRMETHIATVVGRYRGKITGWDVVNEAIDDGEGFLRASPWFQAAGEDFIVEAFQAAHLADPDAQLYYNDYGIESGRKREKALRLIQLLKSRGAPIQGIGIQGHWSLDRVPYDEIEKAIIAFHAEGLRVAITELDIDVVPRRAGGADTSAKETATADPYAAGCPPEILARQAEQYGRLFALFKKHADKIDLVTFWGLHDGRSWLNGWPRKRTNHPLLWDRQLAPKPALDAVLHATVP